MEQGRFGLVDDGSFSWALPQLSPSPLRASS